MGWGGVVFFVLIFIFGVYKYVFVKRRMYKLLVFEGSFCKVMRIYKYCSNVFFRGVLSELKVIVDVYFFIFFVRRRCVNFSIIF